MKKNMTLEIIANTAFYLTLFLLFINFYLNTGLEPKNADEGLRGTTLLAATVSIGGAFLSDQEFRKILLGKMGFFYAIFISLYTCIGSLQNGTRFIISDLAAFIGFIVGLAMFRLLVKSCNPKIQLLALISVPTLLLYHSLSLLASKTNIIALGTEYRITTYAESQFLMFLQVPLAIAIGILGRQGLLWKIILGGLLGLSFFCTDIWVSKRSALIYLLLLVILSILVLSYRLSNGLLTTQSSILKLGQIRNILFLIAVLLLIGIFTDFILNIQQSASEYLIFERFAQIESGDKSSQLRVEEAIAAVQSMQDLEWLVGRGIGATFLSPVSNQAATWFHIGIFTFLLKGGLVLFAFVIFNLYFKFPLLFVKALLKPMCFEPKRRAALLTIFPGVFSWAIALLMVGNLHILIIIPLGFGLGAYLHFKQYGISL